MAYLSSIHDSVTNYTGLTNDTSLNEIMKLQYRDTGTLQAFCPEDGHICEEQIWDSK